MTGGNAPIARILSETDRTRYDAFVASSPLADVLQSWSWGEVKSGSGWQPARFAVERDGTIVAAAQVLRTRPVRCAPPILYAPRGPVLDYADSGALDSLIGGIGERAGGAIFLKCDPPVERGSSAAAAILRAGFRPAGGGGFGGVQPAAVMVLDLRPGLDAVHDGFHKKWKYNIRLAERRGVEVTEGSRDELKIFYDLLLETARRDGFLVRGRDYFEHLYDILEPAGRLKLFLTRYDGRPVAGAMLLCFGKRATYTYGASSNEHRNVMPNHLMQWTMIRWAAENGYETYDFRGVSPVRDGKPVDEGIAGLNRFKEGFGARYVEYAGEFDLPLRRPLYLGWRYGAPLAMKALKLLRGRGGSLAE